MNDKDPIDVVIAWVDGNDPAQKQKMQPYLNKLDFISEDLSGPTRFRSEGEILYCVASILRFAAFVRKIFIVTDQQNPNLDHFIQINFPENRIPVEIVDHTIIFKGYEQILPVFNSLSIETCLFRIPDLSENFVYLNDDFFLVRPINETDWFIDNQAVGYGYWSSVAIVRLLKFLKQKKNGHKSFGFKDSMINGAKILGLKSYFHIDHTPQAMNKSILENYFAENPEKLIANIDHKFRDETQFNPQALFYMLALKAGKCISTTKNKLLYLKPVNRGKSYIERKMKTFENQPDISFCCIGSIDLASKEYQTRLFTWLKTILNLKFDIL